MEEGRVDPFGDVSAPCGMLAKRDAALKVALKAIGRPHIRRRPAGFEGLFRIIVEQQVSVPSAQAILARCRAGLEEWSPGCVLGAGVDGLKSLGLSTPKARYILSLAEMVESGALDFEALSGEEDERASAILQSVKGIGPWTAGIYLLFCEGRLDIWPPGDVALQAAYGAAAGLPAKIGARELNEASALWAPWRGLAAHILWTYYAHLRGRAPI